MGAYAGPEIINNDLVLHLDASNVRSYPGNGTSWNDLSSSSSNATLTGGTSFDTSNGGVITFDGIDGKVPGPVAKSKIGNTTTYAIWFKADPSSGRKNLAWTFSDGLIVAGNNNNLYYYDGITYRSTTIPIFDSTWKNLVRVDNGSGNSLDFYLNGVLVETRTSSIVYGSATNQLFTSYNSLSGFFAGSVSNMQIYNRPLSASEVLQNFNALRGRFNL